MLRGLAAIAVLLGLLVAVDPAGAAPLPNSGLTRDEPLPSPRALVVRGSHGDEFVVGAEPGDKAADDQAVVMVRRAGGSVSYRLKANLAGEGIRANLGRLGLIRLAWKPSGKVRLVRGHCGRRRWKLYFDEGAYVGTLRLRVGGGASAVTAHRVVWRADWYPSSFGCSIDVSEGMPGPGAVLEAGHASEIWEPVHLSVFQKRPGARVSYDVQDFEKAGRIGITRAAYASGGPKTLVVGDGFRTGRIRPPAPFSGTGLFERQGRRGARGTWRGDLSVEFLDGTVMRLAGRSFEAIFHSGFYEERYG
jgi:hypothetical protein